MVNLTLPFRLNDPAADPGVRTSRAPQTTVALPFGTWESLVQGIRDNHPAVAERVLTHTGSIAAGFALVVNDEVVHGSSLPAMLNAGDELYIIPTFAGG